jgi:hypothetical protein
LSIGDANGMTTTIIHHDRSLATFKSVYLLRSPSYKRLAWQDLLSIAKMLEQTKPPSS